MLKCFIIRKKLYEYLDNALSEEERIKVEKHLDICFSCRTHLNQMANIIDLAQRKTTPHPSEEFWRTFKVELDRKLNERLVSPLKLKPSWAYSLKPAFAVVSLVVVVLSLHLYFYGRTAGLSKQDLALIEEVNILEEVTMQPYLNHNEDAYIEEFYIQDQLSQNPT